MVKNRWTVYLVLAGVFVLGAASGGAGAFAYVQQKHAAFLRQDRHGFEDRRLRALTRKLDLDETQQQRVRAILEKDGVEARNLSRDMLDRCGQPLRDHKVSIDAEIRAVLRPEQQQSYDQLTEERRERMWLAPEMEPHRGHPMPERP